jgi:glycosyltransferase involved in cell wall biosynthesis
LKPSRVFITPPALEHAYGGPGTFSRNLAKSLEKEGIEVRWGLTGSPGAADSVLVVNGTKSLLALFMAKRRGAKIVQRLGQPPQSFIAMNGSFSWRLRVKLRGALTSFIRSKIATHVTYQSGYTRKSWHKWYGKLTKPESVIMNGVDSDIFKPIEAGEREAAARLVVIEGNIGGEPFELPQRLSDELTSRGSKIEIDVYGSLPGNTERKTVSRNNLRFNGRLKREELIQAIQGATACLLTDLVTSASPNSLIEAMACGVPGLAYDCGPAGEIISAESGVLVPTLADPTTGAHPENIGLLADSIQNIHDQLPKYSTGARTRMVEKFDMSSMANRYIEILSAN